MRADTASFTFVCLLERQRDADDLARLIDSLVIGGSVHVNPTVVPDQRGTDFFRSGGGLERGDTAFLVCNEEGLADAARQAHGVFFVAHPPASTAVLDPRWLTVRVSRDEAVLALGEAAVRYFTSAESHAIGQLFDARAADLLRRIRDRRRPDVVVEAHPTSPARAGRHDAEDRRPRTPRARPLLPPLLGGLDEVPPGVDAADPFDLLIDASAQPQARHRQSQARHTRSSNESRPGLRSPLPRRRGAGDVTELADRLVARAPMVVVVGSRKGGVGKTSHAAGVAIVAGAALDAVGHRAAIVDANIANPDAWGHLNLPAEASTVRTLAAALAAGNSPPPPVNAQTPGLACYPETREGAEYSRTDIRRVAAHLRARFAFVIVDMSNRLPDPTAGPEAATAAFWLEEADALVLPTACSRQDFAAVLDYLDVEDLPPVIVPCLTPSSRRNRRHPLTRQYLTEIARRVDQLVEMPDEADRVRFAGMEGVAVQEVSPSLRQAYRQLTASISRLPRRNRR